MQAITIAIGKAGVNFFAQHYLVGNLINLLNKLAPPNNTIPVPNFAWNPGPFTSWGYSNISIALSEGSLVNFAPTFQSVAQGVTSDSKKTPIFTVTLEANNFSANYHWVESYHYDHYWKTWMGKVPIDHHSSGDSSTPLSYSPSFASLTAAVVVEFLYSSVSNAWEVSADHTTVQTSGEQANIPSASILQNEETSCFSSNVSTATAQAVDNINFTGSINSLITGILATIPASGDLGDGIKYDFSLGDSGLLFPNNDGIQMGVKGGATYNGTPFSEAGPPSLPLPAPLADSDTHHLNMYVSNYEVDALNWAYYKAGKLNLKIEPKDLPAPSALDVKTYTTFERTLTPYAAFVMHAEVVQNAAPVSSFQTVYVYNADVMTLLKKQLPADIYQLIEALSGNAYLSQSDVDAFLASATVPKTYFTQIENAGKITAMVVTQDMSFTLLIQNKPRREDQPYIKFKVLRADVMTGLKMGLSTNNTQTLQYGFANASNEVTYTGSSIPEFDGATFQKVVWPVTAEPLYVQNLQQLGKTGVPLPIMQGFQFVFDKAQISTQQGYVSILADVEFKSHKAVKAAY
jgi:hypothetical protein